MPVVRPSHLIPPTYRHELVAALAAEIAAESSAPSNREPLVIERPIPPTDRIFPVVIWSAWEETPFGERTGLILDAYRRADQDRPTEPPRAPRIATATGLTWDEADDNGIFKATVTFGEAPLNVVQEALKDVGGFRAPGVEWLRFFSRREAQQAADKLRAKLPSVPWSVNTIVPGHG